MILLVSRLMAVVGQSQPADRAVLRNTWTVDLSPSPDLNQIRWGARDRVCDRVVLVAAIMRQMS